MVTAIPRTTRLLLRQVVWGDAPRGSRSPNPPNLRLTILRAVLRCFLLTTPDRRVVALAAAFAVGDAAPSCAPLRAQVMRLPVRLACESPARLPPPSSLLAPEAVRSQY
ncbi:hypothetical protein BD310DRAFT_654149 [Dichomitus squalens]|uniref:Uncharacterized protein n=1 Tax=Dichomitus squalens TaxID=114155 RepID=A0A4Q9PNG2_9APHY|nr:hypothetical protein BD310DRAFT_654149 [Dichomitus squalens]